MKSGILLGQLDNKGNEAALVRSAEAFGINEAHIVGETNIHLKPSCGAGGHVTAHHYDSVDEFIASANENNYTLVAIEYTDSSEPIEASFDWPANPIFCVGNEGHGLPQSISTASRNVAHITMSPNSYVRCLNAATAGAIVIHQWYSDVCAEYDERKQTSFEPLFESA